MALRLGHGRLGPHHARQPARNPRQGPKPALPGRRATPFLRGQHPSYRPINLLLSPEHRGTARSRAHQVPRNRPGQHILRTRQPAPRRPTKLAILQDQKIKPMEKKKVHMDRVIDGDTVQISYMAGILRTKRTERIRLWGIDAPESSQKGGKESTKHLKKLIGTHHTIWLESTGMDQYQRTIGLIYRKSPKESYNLQMVKDGQAHCYLLSGPEKQLYEQAQEQAQEQEKGIWKPQKRENPWDYRKKQKASAAEKQKLLHRLLVVTVFSIILATILYYLYTKVVN